MSNIFKEGELDKSSVCAIFAHTAEDGKNYNTQFYNLDAIISVGYRVNSIQATRFRKWATKTLKDYIIKGFVINDEFLKNGPKFGKDYFDELLERIKEISFLQFNEYDLLQNVGKVSRQVAEDLAMKEYEKYRVIQDQDYESDFDKATEKYFR